MTTGARVAQLLHTMDASRRVSKPASASESRRSSACRRRVIVLHDDGDADAKRVRAPAGAALGVGVSLFHAFGFSATIAGQARPISVVRLVMRARVSLDKIVRRNGPDPLRGEQLDNGLLGDVEGRRSRGRQRTDRPDGRSLCREGCGQRAGESRGESSRPSSRFGYRQPLTSSVTHDCMLTATVGRRNLIATAG